MTPATRAQLALLLEVASTPTPGAIDRERDHADLRFDHFMAGTLGAADGLEAAAGADPIGTAFERAVRGMAGAQSGGNTQLGALLLLVPMVRAAAADELTPEGATAVVERTTVEDAVAFCRAFDAVPVGLGPPPDGSADLDLREPAAAAETIEGRGISLEDLMSMSAETDGIAREWTNRFERSFGAAERLQALSGPLTDRGSTVFLELLATEPDTFIAKRFGEAAARRASDGAAAVLAGDREADDLADSLQSAGHNPGTTADLLAGGLFIALERGASI